MNYLNTSDDKVYTAKGGTLSTVVDEADLPKSLVFQALATSANTHTIRNPHPAVDSSGNPVIAFGYSLGDVSSVKFGRLSGGNWSFQDITTGGNGFNHFVPSGTGFDLLYSNGGTITSVHRASNGALTTQFNLPVDMKGTNATGWSANYTVGGGPLVVSGTTVNGDERKSDYSGKWPIFAIHKR